MKKTAPIILSQQNKESALITSQLGVAISLILSCANYSRFRVASIGAWLRAPILLRQIQFFYNRSGAPIGYITWAYLARDVEERVKSDPNFLLHTSEWNEGDHLWIIDFAAPSGMVGEIVSYIRQNMFQEFSELHYLRKDSSGNVRKICAWKNPNIKAAE